MQAASIALSSKSCLKTTSTGVDNTRGLYFHMFGGAGGRVDFDPVFLQPVDVKTNRLADIRLDGRDILARRHTAGQVRHISREIFICLFDHDRVEHHRDSLSSPTS